MNCDRDRPNEPRDPGNCRHARFQRIGIQRAPVAPHRLYLMTCRACGTTLATATLRAVRETVVAAVDDEGAVDDRDDEGPGRDLPRRKAG